MKKITAIFLLSLPFFACSSDSNDDPDPLPIATEKRLVVSDTNIPVTQGELLVFVNGSSQSGQTNRMVKVGDVVRIMSGSFASPTINYYITVKIGAKVIVDRYYSGTSQQMNWIHTVTAEDFQ